MMASFARAAIVLWLTSMPVSAVELGRADMRLLPPLGRDSYLPDDDVALQDAILNRRLREQISSNLAQQIDVAADGLAAQQRITAARLEESELEARRTLAELSQATGSMTDGRSFLSSQSMISPESTMGRVPPRAKDPSLLQKVWQQRSPALSGLMEVAVYGYFLTVVGFVLIVTAIYSALCTYFGKFRQNSVKHFQAGDSVNRSSERAPSAPAPMDTSASLQTGVMEEELDGVEAWVKVKEQRQNVCHAKPQKASREIDQLGYDDPDAHDDADAHEGIHCSLPAPAFRYHPCGYVDEL